jgi:hypothetical protein
MKTSGNGTTRVKNITLAIVITVKVTGENQTPAVKKFQRYFGFNMWWYLSSYMGAQYSVV